MRKLTIPPTSAIKGRPGIQGVPERLACVRAMRRMTQAELAEKASLTPVWISHFERGKRLPSAPNLRKLCVALNTSADYILDCQD